MEEVKPKKHLSYNIGTNILRYFTKIFKYYICERATIHKFNYDPQLFIIIKSLITVQDIVLSFTQLHKPNFIFNKLFDKSRLHFYLLHDYYFIILFPSYFENLTNWTSIYMFDSCIIVVGITNSKGWFFYFLKDHWIIRNLIYKWFKSIIIWALMSKLKRYFTTFHWLHLIGVCYWYKIVFNGFSHNWTILDHLAFEKGR